MKGGMFSRARGSNDIFRSPESWQVDRVDGWKPTPNGAIQNSLKKQKEHTQQQFEILSQRAILGMNELGFNCAMCVCCDALLVTAHTQSLSLTLSTIVSVATFV
jgi:hypothetical protein